ncbi:MAG: hypothetical protein PVF05_09065 [Gemmatimonadales bacterium]|jgi:hypothetical protein
MGSMRGFGRNLRELVVVVAGILIAFTLDAWWDGRTEAEWRQSELQSLRQEFTESRVQLEQWIRIHEMIADRTGIVIETLESAPAGAAVPVPDSVLAGVLVMPTYDPTLGTLEALLASGDLSRLREPRLISLLARWPGLVADVREDEESVVRHVQTQLIPLLGARVDLARVQDLRRAVVGRVVRETSDSMPGTIQPLIHERAVVSSLGVNLDYHRQATGGLRELGTQIDSVLALLGAEER